MALSSCLCGGVAWEASGFGQMSHCHCSMCRKAHGSAFATYVAAETSGFRWLRGGERVVRYESSPGFARPFCSTCGSVVAGEPVGDRVFVPAGCLDDDPGVRPEAHIFVASKAPWHEISDDLPRFDEYPPGFETPQVSPRPELPGSDGVRGSCLCGGVAYAVGGKLELIVDCHCSRCRKARSAAHGSNLFADTRQFDWLRGEALLETYRVPDAERFGTCFCRVCGSQLPRPRAGADRLAIPAGSLDDDPGARERLHIFVGSKAAWFEITDDLPRFEEYPTASA